jgi:hypothetical protein
MNTESGEIHLSQMQAIRYLGAYLVRREWIGALVTFLFTIYIGVFMSFVTDGLFSDEEVPSAMIGMLDWIYITMLPCVGMLMNRTAFAMWRDDIYTKRLAHFRTLPIPLATILQVRVIQSVMMLSVNGCLFFFLQYLFAPELQESVSLGHWLAAGLIWMCFSFMFNAFYTYVELGFSGKRYSQIYLAIMVVKGIIVAVLTWQGVHLVLKVLELAKSDLAGLWITLFVIAAVMATWMGYRFTLRRLQVRSITF